jgi:hypothetical protein
VEIEWVNHAGFIAKQGATALLSDPWLDGTAFDHSWALVAPSSFGVQDFQRVTHIWLSHEHPDHFSPRTLAAIPAELRQRITVLYQVTRDKRVVSFCRSLGFEDVVELGPRWYPLSQGLDVFCGASSDGAGGDSWLVVRSPEHRVVNLADCECSDAELGVLRTVAGRTDVCLTQFSYACWCGNPEDVEARRREAAGVLRRVVRDVSALSSAAVIPAASFVYFCHEQNQYMNDGGNRVVDAYREITRAGRRAIVLYPGDRWQVGSPWSSEVALARYARDYDRVLGDPVRTRSTFVELSKLSEAADGLLVQIKRNNSLLLQLAARPCTIDLADHGISLRLGRQGLVQIDRRAPHDHDIALRSDALLACLSVPWGGETLYISGRYRAPSGGNQHRFFRWPGVAQANANHHFYDARYFFKRLREKLGRRLGARVRQ